MGIPCTHTTSKRYKPEQSQLGVTKPYSRQVVLTFPVIPAKAGIQRYTLTLALSRERERGWIPAFAGMTA